MRRDGALVELVRNAPQSRQDRAGDAQAQKIMDDLYAEVRELRAELEAADGYIKSLEARCAMQARQLGYG